MRTVRAVGGATLIGHLSFCSFIRRGLIVSCGEQGKRERRLRCHSIATDLHRIATDLHSARWHRAEKTLTNSSVVSRAATETRLLDASVRSVTSSCNLCILSGSERRHFRPNSLSLPKGRVLAVLRRSAARGPHSGG